MDIESIGLNDFTGKNRITEISFVALSCDSFLHDWEKRTIPRVLNTMTLCFNPGRVIPANVSELTGLYNDELEPIRTFGKLSVDLICDFLNHIGGQSVLIAHNGQRFDFPLLMAKISEINPSAFSSDLLSADTVDIFRALFREKGILDTNDLLRKDSPGDSFSTPKKRALPPHIPTVKPSARPGLLTAGVISGSRRKLDFTLDSSYHPTKQSYMREPSFSLVEIHRRFFGDIPKESHRSMDDCLTLIRCARCVAPHFLTYLHNFTLPINTFIPSIFK
ncbi:three prime repair exonuclease 2-like [Octopus sinensis]|uniref:Three prime repair exonuclease 2-like n=1 Tax=Octopus sinensis TaxID=2607531 RepID=A0A6P7TVG8_9MOLL|nr:three prime repair exonuclease 2-like [Octopus sinensis]